MFTHPFHRHIEQKSRRNTQLEPSLLLRHTQLFNLPRHIIPKDRQKGQNKKESGPRPPKLESLKAFVRFSIFPKVLNQ